MLTAVHAANVLIHEPAPGETPGATPELDVNYLAVVGMTDRLECWRTEAEKLANPEPV